MKNRVRKPRDEVSLLGPNGRIVRTWSNFLTGVDYWTEVVEKWLAPNAVYSSYASMEAPVPPVTLGAAWTPLANYDKRTMPDKDIVSDLAAGTLTFPRQTVYVVNVRIELLHDVTGATRLTNVRGFNTVDEVSVGAGVPVNVQANTDTTVVSVPGLFPLDAANAGKPIRLEIGGQATVNVSGGTVLYEAWCIGEWRDTIPVQTQGV